MADSSDVRDAIVGLVAGAIYPNGSSNPSAIGAACRIFAGWPVPDSLDADLAAGTVNISVYGLGYGVAATQVWEDPDVLTAPVHSLSTSADTSGHVTIAGTPGIGEYVTFLLDNRFAFAYVAIAGDTNITVAAALAALVAAQYPGTSANAGVVTIVGFTYLSVRIGAPGQIGENLHNQKHRFQVTVFAPTPALRDTAAKIVDPVLKANFRLTLPDTTTATMFADGEIDTDDAEKANAYLRRLFYTAEYTTIDIYPGYEVTVFDVTLDSANSFIVNTGGSATTTKTQPIAI